MSGTGHERWKATSEPGPDGGLIGAPGRYDVDVDGAAGAADIGHLRLVPSVEPAVVFASLAARCVPDVCDDCTIDVVDRSDRTDARYRLAFPPRAAATGEVQRGAVRAADRRLRVTFAHPPPEDLPVPVDTAAGNADGFHGQVAFAWHRRMPTRSDRILAAMLVNEAVHTVLWQRTEQAARVAVADAAHLKAALRNSRHIGAATGILMSRHKLTQEQAFELLRAASQHTNRKLRDLALDVLETGGLNPALTTDAAVGEHHLDDVPDHPPEHRR